MLAGKHDSIWPPSSVPTRGTQTNESIHTIIDYISDANVNMGMFFVGEPCGGGSNESRHTYSIRESLFCRPVGRRGDGSGGVVDNRQKDSSSGQADRVVGVVFKANLGLRLDQFRPVLSRPPHATQGPFGDNRGRLRLVQRDQSESADRSLADRHAG
ncbi:unnamed protein product [Protopolystoma xenopodis]|uniref:Uncharacterized protein n=1 Tax=Protopolystoma xenopodis TaxID=117903 RepID=A0A448WFN3_9PLAT|nr:unnamed protein product [Protopolystoma xenopodis]